MSKSNWKGSSGWGSISDPTGVLGNLCLHVSSGIGQICEDYLVQEIGTSNDFNKSHYIVQCDLAYMSHENFRGSFSLVARASEYTTSVEKPFVPQQSYIAIVDVGLSLVKIIRQFDGKNFQLLSKQLNNAISPNTKNTISFSCFGGSEQGKTSLILKLNSQVIASTIDSSGLQILSGTAGIQVQNGSVYINNFSVMELDSSGNPV